MYKSINRYMSVDEQKKFHRGLKGQGQPSTKGKLITVTVTVGRQVMAGCRYRVDVASVLLER